METRMDKRLIEVIERPWGEMRVEEVTPGTDPADTMEMRSAYAPDGSYIGEEGLANILHGKGIVPQRARPDHTVASIGYSAEERKWYGWSHRARFGFEIGSEVKAGDVIAADPGDAPDPDEELEQLEQETRFPVGFTAETLGDCYRMAVAFAEGVS